MPKTESTPNQITIKPDSHLEGSLPTLAELKAKIKDDINEFTETSPENFRCTSSIRLFPAKQSQLNKTLIYPYSDAWYNGEKINSSSLVKTIKANAARIELEREFYPAQSSSNQCPPGTNMVTVDERWKVLFIRGGKKKEIGCMTQQQLADFNSRIHLQGQRQRQEAWRNLQRNRPVNCYGSSSTVGGSTYGSATCY